MSTANVIEADCIEAMREMDEASIDAIVCDPPYGLEFMGKDWDRLAVPKPGNLGGFADGTKPSFERVRRHLAGMQEWHEAWAREALRTLKPGGHLLAFGGTRTYHRLACAVEDAGFEIRDSLIWLYGSGFPKSLDVSKAIDKAAGAEREVVGPNPTYRDSQAAKETQAKWNGAVLSGVLTAPATAEAQQWQGWGTALKPGHEPIVVARKPLIGTVSQNVLAHGTGALNIDGCRIGAPEDKRAAGSRLYVKGGKQPGANGGEVQDASHDGLGRWPANVALDEAAAAELDAQSGERPNGGATTGDFNSRSGFGGGKITVDYGDTGGASRFFLTAGFSTLDEWPQPGERSEQRTDDSASTSAGKKAESSAGSSPTDGSGSKPTDPFPAGTTSITETTTRSTTTSPTSNSSSEFDTSDTTGACEPLRSSETGSASAPDAESGNPSPPSPPEQPDLDRLTAESAAPNTSVSGASETASTTTPTCGPIALDSNPDVTRFRYQAKSSRAERNAGLDGFEERENAEWGKTFAAGRNPETDERTQPYNRRAANHHPTVKPVDLMRWLVRLVTPPGGTVLDPFTGSGTTGCAAVLEDFDFIGIEREAEYAEIARARIDHYARQPKQLELVA